MERMREQGARRTDASVPYRVFVRIGRAAAAALLPCMALAALAGCDDGPIVIHLPAAPAGETQPAGDAADALSLDIRALKKSCIHIAQPDGRLIPFESFNLFYRDGLSTTLETLRAEVAASTMRRRMPLN